MYSWASWEQCQGRLLMVRFSKVVFLSDMFAHNRWGNKDKTLRELWREKSKRNESLRSPACRGTHLSGAARRGRNEKLAAGKWKWDEHPKVLPYLAKPNTHRLSSLERRTSCRACTGRRATAGRNVAGNWKWFRMPRLTQDVLSR